MFIALYNNTDRAPLGAQCSRKETTCRSYRSEEDLQAGSYKHVAPPEQMQEAREQRPSK